MIRTTDLKSKFIPIEKRGNAYIVRWGKVDYEIPEYKKDIAGNEIRDEQGMPVPTGVMLPTDLATWCEEIYYFKPSVEYLKDEIYQWYNKQIDAKILQGFTWYDVPVWLSQENQFNYKAAYDLAVQSQGKSLPVTFKFGTVDNPTYHTFLTMEDLNDFYTKAMKFINDTLAEGWKVKDSIDWTQYEINE